ncbi:MAG: DUF2599 domain-containing protein [Candidatus Nanopelagicales bacterium]|nr:DUF2599 domain-containing protein [Candidatus Nanopelagicales bacterium]MDZ4249001.1 DUF2599 domain-containing protein [Candidatus Nanopelagicales bacterium]
MRLAKWIIVASAVLTVVALAAIVVMRFAVPHVAAPRERATTQTDPGLADLLGEPKADTGSPPVMIRSVTVTSTSEGVRYIVTPTRAGRLATSDSLGSAWQQAVAKGVPERPGLRQQFMCHPLSIVARAKPTWDLEDWRPTVGLTKTMLAGCNPF